VRIPLTGGAAGNRRRHREREKRHELRQQLEFLVERSRRPVTPPRQTYRELIAKPVDGVVALACNFNIRIPSLELVAWQLQPPRRPGWNNSLRNYI
jgi:hypothetical protein